MLTAEQVDLVRTIVLHAAYKWRLWTLIKLVRQGRLASRTCWNAAQVSTAAYTYFALAV